MRQVVQPPWWPQSQAAEAECGRRRGCTAASAHMPVIYNISYFLILAYMNDTVLNDIIAINIWLVY